MFTKFRAVSAIAVAATLAGTLPSPANARDGVNAILGGLLGVVTLGAIASANSQPQPPVAYQVYEPPPPPPVVYYAPSYSYPPPVVTYVEPYRPYYGHHRRYWD